MQPVVWKGSSLSNDQLCSEWDVQLNLFIYQILPICLIFLLVICVPCPRSYVNLYVLLLLLLIQSVFIQKRLCFEAAVELDHFGLSETDLD